MISFLRWLRVSFSIATALCTANAVVAVHAAALETWVGTYPNDRAHGLAFLEIPDIRDRIIETLGNDALPHIKEMAKVGPIIRRGDWLIAYGCQPDACADAKWWFAINLTNLETRACIALLNSSTVRLGASGRSVSETPRSSPNPCPEPEKILLASEAKSFSLPTNINTSASRSGDTLRVPLKKDGGTFGVPIEVNGVLTLFFIVDSGATDVTLPVDVFSALVRTGTIEDSDLLGEETYVLADGSKVKAPTFSIKSLKVGATIVKNVKGSVSPSKGILLLGQSFLGRFKSWSIDNARHDLVLEVIP